MGAEPKTTEKQGGTWGLWVRASLDLLRFFFLKFGFICIQFKKPCREIQGHISLAQCHNPDIDFFFSVKIQNISSLRGPLESVLGFHCYEETP